MKIKIDELIDDKTDRRQIGLLENTQSFEKDVKDIRTKFGIPQDGFKNKEGYDFDGNYLVVRGEGKLELNRTALKQGNDEYFKMLDEFIDDPASLLKNGKYFRKLVLKICNRSKYKLGMRWYHAVCYIVLFSYVEWLPPAIQAEAHMSQNKPSAWITDSIVIHVNKPVSKRGVRNWIDENWDDYRKQLLELNVQKQADLPRDIYAEVDRLIVYLRDKEGSSFHEICEALTKRYENLDDNHPLLILARSEEAVYRRYKRFKQRTT